MMRIKCLKVLLFIVLLGLVRAESATLYVSTQGNDSNPGTASAPFRTITHAYGLASAGTTILVAPGTYTDYTSAWGIHLGKSGTASSPIILRSQTPGAAIIDRQQASDGNAGFDIDGNYNIVDGFEIKNCPHEGATVWAVGVQIMNCYIHNNTGSGIYAGEETSGCVYSANTIARNGLGRLDHGMYLCGKSDTVINNVLLGNAGSGIQVAGYTTVSNMKIYNNVIAYNGTQGIILWLDMNGVDIKNNIFYANATFGINTSGATGGGVNLDHNLFYANPTAPYNLANNGSSLSSYTTGSAINSDPGLVNATLASFDAHLKAGSPAIGSALNLYSTLTTDMAGAARPSSGSWDLGSYKYGSTTQTNTGSGSSTGSTGGTTTPGATLYVSTQGSDSAPGTAAQPFRTITQAYSKAGPGTTILVAPGTYTDYTSGWGIHLGASGTASSPITLRSQTPGAAVIDGQNASDRNEAFNIDGNYNIVDGFEIKGGPNGGIAIWGNYNQILNCIVHNNGNPANSSSQGQDGIYSDQNTVGTVYSGNYIHHNGRTGNRLDHGLYVCGKNESIINNVVLANAGSGIQVAGYTSVDNLKIYNNVIAYNGTQGIILWQTFNGVDIKNNIFYANTTYGINTSGAVGSGVNVDHNLFYANPSGPFSLNNNGSTVTYTTGSAIYNDPGLVNETVASFDAHIKAGSPSIQSALNLSSTFTKDMAGAARPSSGAWDLGTYNYATNTNGSTGSTQTNPPSSGSSGGTTQTNPPSSGSTQTNVPSGGITQTNTGSSTGSTVTNSTSGATTVSVVASIPNAVIGTTNYGAFTFTRTGSTASALTVNYSLGGTAVKWNDYYRYGVGDMPVSITIPAGSSSYTMYIVARGNARGVNPETVTITLSASSAYQVASPASATMTILATAPSTPTSTADTTAPTASISSPVNGATISGTVTVSCNASDNVGVASVQFQCDGVNVGSALTTAPYSVALNTTGLANGSHSVMAIVRDAAGNQTTTTAVTLNVANSSSTSSGSTGSESSTGLPSVTVAASIPTAVIGTTKYGAFTFSRTGSTANALNVNYSLGGTAVKWNDYYRYGVGDMPVSITIPAGSSSYTMYIVARSNQTGSNPETVTINLSPNSSYQVGSPASATMTIVTQ